MQGHQRQQVYIRALETIPILKVFYGQFLRRDKHRPLLHPIQGLPEFVWIKGIEEKGTDVNLATYLIADGYLKDYEQASVISNDSDLALPFAMVRDEFEIPIAVVNPNLDPTMRTHEKLSDAATFERPLREVTLGECQFPPTLQDAQPRTITKPPFW